MTETITKKKKCNKSKWLSEEALQIGKERRKARVKGKICLTECSSESSREQQGEIRRPS